MDEIQELLDEVVKTELQNLQSLEPGSDEQSKAISRIQDLHKLHIEEMKALTDSEDKVLRRNMDVESHDDEERYRRKQDKDAAFDRWLKFGLGLLELGLPLAFYGAWVKMGFEFEKDGSITSGTFKNLIRLFKPTKKS